ncbi:hypothetical protein ACT8ZV_13835 [Nocardioides sp. MAHUQ-72]|uniref:hypothetical protein n=1 Tax=unclassified Nocardioides TaxID=2615069 RepID=UPI0036158E6D
MYGDSGVMRRRAAQLREQGVDLRALADQLVARTESIAWTGRAADSMRQRIRDRAAQVREAAARHETAAESLERHLLEVESLKETIASTERRADALVTEARTRVARVEAHADPAGLRRSPDPADARLAAFTPPPRGHKDWLTVEIPGL